MNNDLNGKVSRFEIIGIALLAAALLATPTPMQAQEHRRRPPHTEPIPASASAPTSAPAAPAAPTTSPTGKPGMPDKAAITLKATAAAGEQFFILSSVDPAKHQLVLKRPTEVTTLMTVTDTTSYLDETGKPLKLTELRAGDTVYVLSTSQGDAGPTASRIRRGPMTLAELHKHYLNY